MAANHRVDRTIAKDFDHGRVLRVSRTIGATTSKRPLYVLSSAADLVFSGMSTLGEITHTNHAAHVPGPARNDSARRSHTASSHRFRNAGVADNRESRASGEGRSPRFSANESLLRRRKLRRNTRPSPIADSAADGDQHDAHPAPGLSLCNGACVDEQTDGNNCGACGVACSVGTMCSGGTCPTVCGDATCNALETCATCAVDCGACPPTCGDGTCNGTETCATCPNDCSGCAPVCGDGICNGTETCGSCPSDCGSCPPTCGDGTCNGAETCASCTMDCGACGTDAGTDAGAEMDASTLDSTTADAGGDDGGAVDGASDVAMNSDVVREAALDDGGADENFSADVASDVAMNRDGVADDHASDAVGGDGHEPTDGGARGDVAAADAAGDTSAHGDAIVQEASSDGGAPNERAGCGCRVPASGSRSTTGFAMTMGLALAALAGRRRRSRRSRGGARVGRNVDGDVGENA